MYFFLSVHTRVVHGSDGPAGRVGSGWVTILPDFGGSGRVSTLDFSVFSLIISWYLNRSKLEAKRTGSSHIFIVSANQSTCICLHAFLFLFLEIFLYFIERKRLY